MGQALTRVRPILQLLLLLLPESTSRGAIFTERRRPATSVRARARLYAIRRDLIELLFAHEQRGLSHGKTGTHRNRQAHGVLKGGRSGADKRSVRELTTGFVQGGVMRFWRGIFETRVYIGERGYVSKSV